MAASSVQSLAEKFDPHLLAALSSLDLKARYIVEGFLAGLHQSPFHGFSSEFSDYRAYQPGDELRHIDWRLYARSDRLCIKRFHQETNVRFYIVLDTSASMAYKGDRAWASKLDYARVLSAALSWLLLKQNDAVGLIAPPSGSDGPIFVRPSQRSNQFGQLLRHLEGLHPSGGCCLVRLLTDSSRLVHRRSVLLLFSDLLEPASEVASLFKQLRFLGHETIVFHVLDRDETDFPFKEPKIFEDLESSDKRAITPGAVRDTYLQRFNAFMKAHEEILQQVEASHLRTLTDDNPWNALAQFLSARRRLK